MKKILLWLFLAAVVPGAAGEEVITYRFQAGIPLHCSSSLRRLEQFLKELFPKTPYRKTPLTIDITGGSGALEAPEGALFEANRFRIERGDLELLSEAGGAMLHAHGKAPAGYRLPLFLCGAFRHRERAAGVECRFLGNNRRFNTAEALLRAGFVPDLKVLLTHVPGERDKIGNQWFDDHARLLFEMLRSKNFKGGPEKLESAAEQLLARQFKVEELRPMIWGNFNLLPPELAAQQLQTMLTLQLPKLDHMNQPNGLTETVTASQLPSKLQKHPLRKEVCSKFASSLFRKGAGLPVFFKGALRKLHDAVRRLGADPAAAPAFNAALAHLDHVRKEYADRAAFLDRLESRSDFPVRMRQRSLRANALPAGIAAPECQRFLERMEEYYTGF